MKILSAVAALILFFAVGATAETTNTLSDAEIQGRALAQRILAQIEKRPETSLTNLAALEIKNGGVKTTIPLTFKIIISATNWQTLYEADTTNGIESITITREADPSSGELDYRSAQPFSIFGGTPLFAQPFAGSDFFVGDLNLEFFGWTKQKVLKKEVHRSCGCTVLESTNPDPSTNCYSRVVSWIDNDSLGIVEAYAYDARGRLLKDFYPKDIRKVNGQWQVQTLVMENVQTGSRSRLEFDLKK